MAQVPATIPAGMWDLDAILETTSRALRDEDARLAAEQSTLGIDALDELEMHPLLARAFEGAGFGVLREQRYPSIASLPRRSEGDRCDLVLTPGPNQALRDPLERESLFAQSGIEPAEALWMEIKLAHQYALTDGALRANPAYSSELLQLVPQDIRKLSRDEQIAHACVILLLFTQDEATALHDLAAWSRRAVENGLPCSAPLAQGLAITDRMGNGACHACLIQVHHL